MKQVVIYTTELQVLGGIELLTGSVHVIHWLQYAWLTKVLGLDKGWQGNKGVGLAVQDLQLPPQQLKVTESLPSLTLWCKHNIVCAMEHNTTS